MKNHRLLWEFCEESTDSSHSRNPLLIPRTCLEQRRLLAAIGIRIVAVVIFVFRAKIRIVNTQAQRF